MDLRQQPRYAVQLPASFSGENISGEGTIVDLSTEGCGIISDTIPVLSSYFTLTVDLEGNVSPLAIDLAAVRWSSRPRFGVEFIRIGVAEAERLRAFVKTIAVNP